MTKNSKVLLSKIENDCIRKVELWDICLFGFFGFVFLIFFSLQAL